MYVELHKKRLDTPVSPSLLVLEDQFKDGCTFGTPRTEQFLPKPCRKLWNRRNAPHVSGTYWQIPLSIFLSFLRISNIYYLPELSRNRPSQSYVPEN